jgi:hypothetical protein
MHLVDQAKLDAAIAGHEGVPPDRKGVLVATVRACRPEKHRELHQCFTEGLTPEEFAFYRAIVVIPPDDEATAAPAAPTTPPAPAPDAAATAVSEGAHAAEAHATRSRGE